MNYADPRALVLGPQARALAPVRDAPTLSHAAADLLREIEVIDEHGKRRAIAVPRERPLSVIFDDRELVTLMTLGGAPEWLVLGYLRNQRLLGDLKAVASITVDLTTGCARVRSRGGAPAFKPPNAVSAATGCGLGSAFADLMTHSQGMMLPDSSAARIGRSTLLSILQTMRSHDDIHRAAGSVHSCAVFHAADLWASIEDVSRHNGIDTITGWMALHGVDGGDKILFTSGRLTGEMVMKAAFNAIPILITRNGVTAMGHELALRLGMTLFGRANNNRYLCYSGAERFDPSL